MFISNHSIKWNKKGKTDDQADTVSAVKIEKINTVIHAIEIIETI